VRLADGSYLWLTLEDMRAASTEWLSLEQQFPGVRVMDLSGFVLDGTLLATRSVAEIWQRVLRVWTVQLRPCWAEPDRWRRARDAVLDHGSLRMDNPDLVRAVRLAQALGTTATWRRALRVVLTALQQLREQLWWGPDSDGDEEGGFAAADDAGFADPGFADPGFADPGFADPGFADPGFADPGFADPGRRRSSARRGGGRRRRDGLDDEPPEEGGVGGAEEEEDYEEGLHRPHLPRAVRAGWLHVLAEHDGLLCADADGEDGSVRGQTTHGVADVYGVMRALPRSRELMGSEWPALRRCVLGAPPAAAAPYRVSAWPLYVLEAAFRVACSPAPPPSASAAGDAAAGGGWERDSAPVLQVLDALLPAERAVELALRAGNDAYALRLVAAAGDGAGGADRLMTHAAAGDCVRTFLYVLEGMVSPDRHDFARMDLAAAYDRAYLIAAGAGSARIVERVLADGLRCKRRRGQQAAPLGSAVITRGVATAVLGGHAAVVDAVAAATRSHAWLTPCMLRAMFRAGTPTLAMLRAALRMRPDLPRPALDVVLLQAAAAEPSLRAELSRIAHLLMDLAEAAATAATGTAAAAAVACELRGARGWRALQRAAALRDPNLVARIARYMPFFQ
jgi:hypothetical protein